jgi:hypothetical protein
MKTLKEELQEIVDEKKLEKLEFICAWISIKNRNKFQKYRNMAKSYAEKHINPGDYCWWNIVLLDDIEVQYIISEKYRFIKDLIAIL